MHGTLLASVVLVYSHSTFIPQVAMILFLLASNKHNCKKEIHSFDSEEMSIV